VLVIFRRVLGSPIAARVVGNCRSFTRTIAGVTVLERSSASGRPVANASIP